MNANAPNNPRKPEDMDVKPLQTTEPYRDDQERLVEEIKKSVRELKDRLKNAFC
jgi:hypothetical protein